jgi:polyphosphate kinase 2 (PPK2 family)
VRERRFWDEYQQAYEDALGATSTKWAPWHVIPSDHKWFRRLLVAQIVAATLEEMDPRWPESEEDLEQFAAEELDQLSRR